MFRHSCTTRLAELLITARASLTYDLSQVNANGNVVRSEILGAVKMKCYLSGMPELRLGLNDKVMFESTGRNARGKAIEMEDVKFHQCVRLSRFENDRTISFIPPDGEFELMRYRSTSNVKLPLRVITTVNEIGTSQVSYVVAVKTSFNNKLSATNVVVRIPTPLNTTNVDCKVPLGKAKYVPAENVVVWKCVTICPSCQVEG